MWIHFKEKNIVYLNLHYILSKVIKSSFELNEFVHESQSMTLDVKICFDHGQLTITWTQNCS